MKRFLQKSYSWLATLFLTVAFAVSGSAAAQGIELPFAFSTSSGGTVDGVGFYMWSANWYDSTELYGEGDANATWGTVNLTSPVKNIVKVELTCRTNSWSSVGSPAAAAATVCETENLGGSFTTNGAVAVWQGSAHNLTFSSTDDIDVYKMVVYLEEGDVVKECTVGVDKYADNCKPGKHEGSLTRYITLYMQENTALTSWTGQDNCPAEVTLTNEAGQKFAISQFNTWVGSNQIGIVFAEEITTPGVYTLHIPEGLVAFESGKFNKEINVVWDVVEPDLRPTKDIVFDFTDGTYTNDGTLSYTKDGVVFTLNENRYNATAQGFRVGTDGWVTFTAPEKATLKHIQLLQESSYGVSPDFIANVGEVSAYDKTLNWSGDDASVTLTDNYGTCYFTKAIVTLAVEEVEEPEPSDPDEACFDAWVALVNGDFAAIAGEYNNEIPLKDVVGKKPIAVAVPCIEYYTNRAGLASLSVLGWQVVNGMLNSYYQTTLADDYAYALELLAAYNAAEVVTEVVVEPTYTEPVLSAEDVSAEVAYYIYTDARGGLTVDGDQLKGTKEVGKNVDATDVNQQFAFVNWEGNLYLYSLAAEKFIGKANRGNFTDEPVDPIYFKNAAGGTVMLYFDDSFNFNLGGSNQVTIDTWKIKDPGNSFKIMVAEKFDQTALLEKLAGGGEVVDPVDPVDLSIFAGEWYFKGEGAYLDYYEESVTPKDEYVVNVAVENGKLYLTDLVGFVYDDPNAFIGTYDAQAETLTFTTPYSTCYVVDETTYEYYTNFKPLVFNVVKDEEGNVSLVNTTGWEFMYEDWFYTTYNCGYTSCVMTREQQIVEPEPEGWTGEIAFSEANNIDDLLTLTLAFEEAKEVKASGRDILGVVFEGNGNPYAIVLGNEDLCAFGNVSINGGKATIEFAKIADLNAELQASAKAAAARISGFNQVPGEASVVFAGKSFKVDGQLVNDIVAHSYNLGNDAPTGIESFTTSTNDTIYDLSGRRVQSLRNGGLYIKNGVKVYMK